MATQYFLHDDHPGRSRHQRHSCTPQSESLVGLVGQEPGGEFHAGDGFEGIIATAGIVVTLETPTIHLCRVVSCVSTPKFSDMNYPKHRDGFQKRKSERAIPTNVRKLQIGLTENRNNEPKPHCARWETFCGRR